MNGAHGLRVTGLYHFIGGSKHRAPGTSHDHGNISKLLSLVFVSVDFPQRLWCRGLFRGGSRGFRGVEVAQGGGGGRWRREGGSSMSKSGHSWLRVMRNFTARKGQRLTTVYLFICLLN